MDDRRYKEALLFCFSISLIVLFPEIYLSYFVFNFNSYVLSPRKRIVMPLFFAFAHALKLAITRRPMRNGDQCDRGIPIAHLLS